MKNKKSESVSGQPVLTVEELKESVEDHVRELKRIEKMTDNQFEAFKRNFSLGFLDPSISRAEAIEVLKSMISTNITLQQEHKFD